MQGLVAVEWYGVHPLRPVETVNWCQVNVMGLLCARSHSPFFDIKDSLFHGHRHRRRFKLEMAGLVLAAGTERKPRFEDVQGSPRNKRTEAHGRVGTNSSSTVNNRLSAGIIYQCHAQLVFEVSFNALAMKY